MTSTAKRIFTPAQLGVSAATYYTVPTNTRCVIKKLTLTNSTGTARTATVYLVPSGGTAGATNVLTSAKTIAPGQTWECIYAEDHVLESGSTLQALAEVASAITIHGSGVEITG